MASPKKHLLIRRVAWACAICCAGGTAFAQTRLDSVTVTGRASPPVSVSGWGDLSLERLPLQASVFSAERLQERGAQRLADLTGFDPAVADAYNAEGYWDQFTVRGFVLDNRFNFRRDGLPINAETSIPLDNKAQIEILKGLSGMQAGTSAPGGLVNLVVKRPTDEPLRRASLAWREHGSTTAAVDLSERFGTAREFGLRLNAAAAHLDPLVRDSEGHRRLFALAGDWRFGNGARLEAEIETSHRSQPSQAGFSLLGDTVPEPADPRLNLNNQPWSQPVVLDADTASLRWRQPLAPGWIFTAHGATQRLRSDDRIAFPFGCTASDGTYYADRYCPDGSFDLYDFRSENERRRSDALDLSVQGAADAGGLRHMLTAGVLLHRVRNRFQRQAFNFAGTGTVDGRSVTDPAPDLTDENTQRDERSTEWYARDAIAFAERWTAWLGLRHSQLHRQSVRTDGSRQTDYRQSFTTPFAALSWAFAPDQLAYASWGRGVQSSVAPNRDFYTNPGEAFTLTSRQAEVGLKGSSAAFEWSLAAFQIEQPLFADVPADEEMLTFRPDGTQRHRGLEAQGAWRGGPWTLRAGGQWLHARRDGSSTAALNGKEPTNVPARTLTLQAEHHLAALPGLTVEAAAVVESGRFVVPDNSVSIPGYASLDMAAHYATRIAAHAVTWHLGIDNLADKRAWRESPYQFGHAYLYPLRPRTAWLTVLVGL
ncbi:MAG: TonB-dependent siderophore receptor [Piscinibacter sp.]|nr:TonB-dependent siderophore receptor [Piscinibacter sp.]